jgi:hypothetical protein
MPDPVYEEIIGQIEDLMLAAHALGLYRTSDKLHRALNEARSEQYEATPKSPPAPTATVDWHIGPVREQSHPSPDRRP